VFHISIWVAWELCLGGGLSPIKLYRGDGTVCVRHNRRLLMLLYRWATGRNHVSSSNRFCLFWCKWGKLL